MEINSITGAIIDESIKIHNDLGPGLLESVYKERPIRLSKSRFHVNRQVAIPLFYEEVNMDIGFCADLIVDHAVIVEIKSVETIAPVHHKQLLTSRKLTDLTVCLLINFNEALLKNGIKRIVNNYLPASSAPQRETKIDEYGKGSD